MEMNKMLFSVGFAVLMSLVFDKAAPQSVCVDPHSAGPQFTSAYNEYDSQDFTVSTCRYGCARKGFSHAGMKVGQACFCSESLWANTTIVDDAECNAQCTGSADMCGGSESMTVAATPDLVTGFNISAPTATVAMLEDTTFTFLIQTGKVTSYSIGYGDGLSATTAENATTHQYFDTGELTVSAEVTDIENNKETVETTVQVGMKTSKVLIESALQVPTEIPVVFDLFVTTGTSVTLSLDMDDGSMVQPISLPDTYLEKVGFEWGEESGNSLSTSKTYLLVNHIVQNAGYVLGWKYNAKGTGDVSFQVYRPTCTGKNNFCYRSYSCYDPLVESCNRTATNFWARSCANGKYSLTAQNCHRSQFYMPTSWNAMPTSNFALVGENSHRILQTGLGWMTLPSDLTGAIAVEKGDIIAVYMISGSLHSSNAEAGYTTYYGDNADPFTSSPSTVADKIHVQALVATSTHMKFTHTYFGSAFVANITATVNDTFGHLVNSTVSVDVQESIRNVTIECGIAATVNVPFEFQIPEHYGNKVTYNITFGDGNTLSTTERNFSHTYLTAEFYTITVFAYNGISDMTYVLWLPAQEAITTLEIDIVPDENIRGTILLTESTQIRAFAQNGTNVTFIFEMGDDTTQYIYHDDFPNITTFAQGSFSEAPWTGGPGDSTIWSDGSIAHLKYMYQETSNFTVTITVANLVSNATVTHYLPVEVPITGLEIIQPDPIAYGFSAVVDLVIATGTRVHFTSSFNEAPTRLFSSGWEWFGGNATLTLADYLVIGSHELTFEGTNFVPPFQANDTKTIWVDYIITDADYIVNTSHVRPMEFVGYTLSMSNGSRMNITVDWNDSTIDEFYVDVMLTGQVFEFSHQFAPAGFYDIVITIVNPVSNVTLTHMVTCQNPVVNIDWTTNSPVSIYPANQGMASFNLTFFSSLDLNETSPYDQSLNDSTPTLNAILPPTDPFYLARFSGLFYEPTGNQSIHESFSISEGSPVIYGFPYDEYGTFPVSINMSNFVSHMYLTDYVVVDQPVLDLEVECDHLLVTFSETLITCSVTMTWGSRLNITWDWQDLTDPNVTVYNRNGTNMVSHLYSTVGVYDLLITTENSVGVVTTWLPSPVICQHPVVNDIILAGKTTVLMGNPYYWSYVRFDFRIPIDIPIPTNTSFTANFADGKTQGVTNIWPSDRDPSLDSSSTKHIYSFYHNYTFGETFNISATLFNLVSNKTFYFNFRIVEAIYGLSKDVFSIDLDNGLQNGTGHGKAYYPSEEEVHFLASLKRASHVTYLWDFGDGDSAVTYPDAFITHKYAGPGTYSVCVNATNPLTFAYLCQTIYIQRSVATDAAFWAETPFSRNETLTYLIKPGTVPATKACYFLDTKDPESAPNRYQFFGDMAQCMETFPLEFRQQPRIFYPMTEESLQSNKTLSVIYQRVQVNEVTLRIVNQVSDETLTHRQGVTRGPCSFPKVDMANPMGCEGSGCDADGYKKVKKSVDLVVAPTVTIKCKSTQIANYTWKMYTMDEGTKEKIPYYPNMTLSGSPLPKLIFPKRSLNYSVYCFSLNVSMWGENGIFNKPGPESEACVRIIKSPLEINYDGFQRKQWGKNHTMDIEAVAFDPDVEESDKTGITYTFMCRRECETLPTYGSDGVTIDTPMTTTCNYTNNTETFSIDRGCDANDGIDTSGLLKYTRGNNRIDLSNFYESEKSFWTVCITKDDRSVCKEFTWDITQGDPPQITIECIANCRHPQKINLDRKFSLTSVVKLKRPGVQYVYKWALRSSQDHRTNFVDTDEIPESDWATCIQQDGTVAEVSTGMMKQSLAMGAGIFRCLPTGDKYFLEVKVYRAGSDPNNYGQAIREVLINKPPLPGNCTCNPCNGTSLNTLYNIHCLEPFIDADGPLIFSFQYQTAPDRPFSVIKESNRDTMPDAEELPQGMEQNLYVVGMRICCRDNVGSETCLDIAIFVYPPPAEKMTEVLSGLSSGGGANPLASVKASGDPALVAGMVALLGATIGGGANSSSEESLKGMEVLSSGVAVLVVDADSYKQGMSAANAITGNPSALTADATSSIVNCISNIVGFLSDGSGVGDDTIEVVNSVLYNIDGAQSAAKANGADPTDSNLAADNALNAIANGMVADEAPTVLSTNDRAIAVASTSSSNLNGATFGSGGGEMEMGDPEGLIGTGNDTTPSMNTKVAVTNSNVFGDDGSNSSSATGVNSAVLAVSFTNASGSALEGSVELEMFIPVPNPPVPVKTTQRISDDPEEMIINKVTVSEGAALLINLVEFFNTSEPANTTNTTDTTDSPFNVTDNGNGTETISFFISTTGTPPTIPPTTTTAGGSTQASGTTTATHTTTAQPTVNCTTNPNHTSCATVVNCTLSPNHTDCQPINCTTYPNHTDCQYNTTEAPTTTATMTTAAPTVAVVEEMSLRDVIDMILSENEKKSKFTLYVGLNEPPEVDKYDYKCTLPLDPYELLAGIDLESATTMMPFNVTNGTTTTPVFIPTVSTTTAPTVNYEKLARQLKKRNMDTCYFNNTLLNFETEQLIYVGVMGQKTNWTAPSTNYTATSNATVNGTLHNNQTVSGANTTTHRRRKREVLLDSAPSSGSSGSSSADDASVAAAADPFMYEMYTVAASCKYYDPDSKTWKTEGCVVGPLTNLASTHCLCTRPTPSDVGPATPANVAKRSAADPTIDPNMIPPPRQPQPTPFGCGLGVPMNTINPSDSAFLKLDSNPIIFSVMVALICIYLTILIWAKKADQMDDLKAATTPLLDNDPRHKYLYELTVYTGSKSRSGTTAKVSMIFSGEEDETTPRLIFDNKRKVLQRGGVDSFLMATPRPLGAMSHIRAWHDNSGSSPGWFFSRMVVKDLQTDEVFFFILDKWLAVEEEDGLIDRMVPLAGKDELTNFNHLFWTKTKNDFSDGHIYFSVFGRPAKSSFTRCQRLTCCLCLLFCTMMANIFFYETSDGSAPAQEFAIGPISFTIPALLTGVYSSLIVFPINLMIVFLFRYTKPPKTKWQKEKEKAIAEAKKALKRQQLTAEDELRQQREFLETGDDNKRLMMGSQTGISYIGSDNGEPQVRITDPKDKNKKKTKFRMPHWVIFPNYLLCLACCGTAFYMTVEVGGVFGAKKSNEWMVSFVVSVLQSIFLTDPIKVIGLAMFYALVIKKPDMEVDDSMAEPGLGKGEEYLHKTESGGYNDGDREFRKSLSKYKNIPIPPDEDFLRAARAKRMKELKMQSLIMEIGVYMFFLYLLMMVGYGNRDPWSNLFYRTMQNEFAHGSYFDDSRSMYSVADYNQFWEWTEKSMVPGIYGDTWYNGKDYWFQVGFFADRANFMMGIPRLRQVRNKPHNCRMPVYRYIKECHDDYDINVEDQRNYRKNWVPVNESDPNDIPDDSFKYRNSTDLDGYPQYGELGYYGGGGYVVELTRDREVAEERIAALKASNWIDQNTRAVFVEFVVYNPALNLHGISFMNFEFLTTGAIYPDYRFYIMRLDRYVGTSMLALLIAEFGAAAFTIYVLVRECRKIKAQGRGYFKEFWNTAEFVVAITMLVAIVMFIYRFVLSELVQANYRLDKDVFVNFQYPATWDELYGYLISFIIFLNTIKFLKLLRFNKKMNQLGMTISTAAKPIMSFLVVLGVVFFSYAIASFLIFGRVLNSFSSFVASSETLFSMMLNKFDYQELETANPVFAPIVFFSFTIIMVFMLINFLLTVILEAYAVVKQDLARQENEYELVEFVVGRFKGMLGMNAGPSLAKTDELMDSLQTKTRDVNRKLAEMMERVEDYIFTSGIDQRVIMDEIDTIEMRKSQALKKKIVTG